MSENETTEEVAKERTAVADVDFDAIHSDAPDGAASEPPRDVSILYDIPLQITARLGSTRMSIKDLLKLGPGAVVALDRVVGESVDLLINGVVVGRGDVVVVNDNYGLRITRVASHEERLKSL
jgi:flagellar motor switch protein FliN/FliY